MKYTLICIFKMQTASGKVPVCRILTGDDAKRPLWDSVFALSTMGYCRDDMKCSSTVHHISWYNSHFYIDIYIIVNIKSLFCQDVPKISYTLDSKDYFVKLLFPGSSENYINIYFIGYIYIYIYFIGYIYIYIYIYVELCALYSALVSVLKLLKHIETWINNHCYNNSTEGRRDHRCY